MDKPVKDPKPEDRDPLYVQSVEKALRILQAFDHGSPSLSLKDLSTITGLDKGAAQRFTHTLVKLDLLRKDSETKRFELTAGTLELGSYYISGNALIRAATPHLLNLSHQAGESVSLTVPRGTDVIYIYRLISRTMLSPDVVVGTRLPAYCTAPGIAMLSTLPEDEVRDILERSDLRPLTANTTWRMPDLMAKVAQTAERGFALCCEEIYANDISVSAAIRDKHGRGVAAVTLAVSKLNMTAEEAVEDYAPTLIAIAGSLSEPRLLRSR